MDDDADRGHAVAPQRTARRRRRSAVVLGTLAATALLVTATGLLLTERYASRVDRIPDPFSPIREAERPHKPPDSEAQNGITFLIAGVDTRSDVPTTGTDAASTQPGHTDAVILARLTGDREHAYVVSIPRDSWVLIPRRGHTRINTAYAHGGATLLVRTVEELTDVRIDHLAVINFAGFRTLTDALGGVTVTVAKRSYDPHRHRVWEAGTHRLDGEAALAYVRQRVGLPRGDLDRAQRQQAFLRALIRKLADQGTLGNPVRLARALEAISRTVTVDEQLTNSDLRALAFGVRGLRPDHVLFATAPVARSRLAGQRSVVQLDAARGTAFWAAFENDELPLYVVRHGGDTLGQVVR
jgi:LCP family protein required for cell wall assembly